LWIRGAIRRKSLNRLAEAIAKANLPEEAESQALKELRRYERMPEGAAEAGMARGYLAYFPAQN
jgi:ATP-dependent Lon protease